MSFTSLTHRRGFTMVELLVAFTIVAVLVAMILPAIGLVQEEASRAQCVDNLRQIGTALHHHHDVFLEFPCEALLPPTGPGVAIPSADRPAMVEQSRQTSLFVKIRPFFEGTADPVGMPIYLCPSREREVPKNDYAAATRNAVIGQETIDGWADPSNESFPSAPLNGINSSTTLLLAEKFVRPARYNDEEEHTSKVGIFLRVYEQQSWADCPGFPTGSQKTLINYDHRRLATNHPYRDFNPIGSTHAADTSFGSPHSRGVSSLFGDGHVTVIEFKVDTDAWECMWDWRRSLTVDENGMPIPVPDPSTAPGGFTTK